jgi:hypothetical protein
MAPKSVSAVVRFVLSSSKARRIRSTASSASCTGTLAATGSRMRLDNFAISTCISNPPLITALPSCATVVTMAVAASLRVVTFARLRANNPNRDQSMRNTFATADIRSRPPFAPIRASRLANRPLLKNGIYGDSEDCSTSIHLRVTQRRKNLRWPSDHGFGECCGREEAGGDIKADTRCRPCGRFFGYGCGARSFCERDCQNPTVSQSRNHQTIWSSQRICSATQALDRRTNHRVAQSLSPSRQGLGKSQPQRSRLPETCLGRHIRYVETCSRDTFASFAFRKSDFNGHMQ